MDQETWKKSEDVINEIAESIDELLDSPELEAIRAQLTELGGRLGKRYNVNLNCILDVVDWTEERCLPLVNTGISTNESGELHRNWNDASPQRYVVNGELKTVPHDHCRAVGGTGFSKLKTRSALNVELN